MTGLYDHLNRKLESDDAPSGVTAMDLIDLPDEQRMIMRALLRDPNGKSGISWEELAARFDDKLSDLWGAVLELKQRGWLIEMGDYPLLSYRVNLRAKRGIQGAGLWAALNDRLT
jgi:hypothetical protein